MLKADLASLSCLCGQSPPCLPGSGASFAHHSPLTKMTPVMVQPTPLVMAPLTMALPMVVPINYCMAYNGTTNNTNNATMAPPIIGGCFPHNHDNAVDFGVGCQVLQWT